MLLNGITIKKMKEGYSKVRNRGIAYALSYMRIIERWGSGIPRMIQECEKYGVPEPELIDCDGDFRINLYRRDAVTERNDEKSAIKISDKMGKRKQNYHQIVNFMEKGKENKTIEIAEKLGLKLPHTRVLLNDLAWEDRYRS